MISTSNSTAEQVNESAQPLHLNESARCLLTESLQARLTAVAEDKFILHPQAKNILSILKRTLAKPESERPSGYVIISPSGSGKTCIVNKLYRD